MPIQKRELIPLALVLLSWAIAALAYWLVPTRIPVASQNNVLIFLLPGIVLVVYLLFQYLPVLEVHAKNIVRFPHLFGVKTAVVLFLFLVYIITLPSAFGLQSPFMRDAILVLVAALLFYLGTVIKEIRRNFFIGIRTPWTLSSDKVWERTHKLGSVTIRLNAACFLLALPYAQYFIWIILVPTIINIAVLFIYSFMVYRKIHRRS
ncbi:SdpI family protein [Candidatus Woesearchaeota archaeon]|nr:SdpI family protein [Candidatus Woesearchaeota archaeon]